MRSAFCQGCETACSRIPERREHALFMKKRSQDISDTEGRGLTRTGSVLSTCKSSARRKGLAPTRCRAGRREAPVENSPAREGGAEGDKEWRSEGPAQRTCAAPSALMPMACKPRPHGRGYCLPPLRGSLLPCLGGEVSLVAGMPRCAFPCPESPLS